MTWVTQLKEYAPTIPRTSSLCYCYFVLKRHNRAKTLWLAVPGSEARLYTRKQIPLLFPLSVGQTLEEIQPKWGTQRGQSGSEKYNFTQNTQGEFHEQVVKSQTLTRIKDRAGELSLWAWTRPLRARKQFLLKGQREIRLLEVREGTPWYQSVQQQKHTGYVEVSSWRLNFGQVCFYLEVGINLFTMIPT